MTETKKVPKYRERPKDGPFLFIKLQWINSVSPKIPDIKLPLTLVHFPFRSGPAVTDRDSSSVIVVQQHYLLTDPLFCPKWTRFTPKTWGNSQLVILLFSDLLVSIDPRAVLLPFQKNSTSGSQATKPAHQWFRRIEGNSRNGRLRRPTLVNGQVMGAIS